MIYLQNYEVDTLWNNVKQIDPTTHRKTLYLLHLNLVFLLRPVTLQRCWLSNCTGQWL